MPHREPDSFEQLYDSHHPIRTLFRMLGLTPLRYLGYSIIFVLKHASMLILPVYVQQMVAIANNPGQYPDWYFWAWNIGFLAAVSYNIPGHLWFVILTHRRIRHMEHRLRGSLVRRLQQLSIAYHTRTESGRLQSKVLRDVDDIVQLSMQIFHGVISASINVFWGVTLAFTTKPMVGFFFIVGAPIAAVLISSFRKRMRLHNHAYRTTMESMSSRVSEMIDTIPITRAHGAENEEIKRTTEHLGKVYRAGMDIDRTNQFFACSSFSTMYIAMGMIIGASSWLAIHHGMPPENIVLYQGLFALVVGSLSQLLGFLPILSRGMESLRSLGEVLECPDLEHNQDKAKTEQVAGGIHFENVSFSYDNSEDRQALQQFTLDIQSGECVAFVGESGSGKTTLMNLAIGFWRPQSGRILLDGCDSSHIDLRSWRQFIAVVPQHTILFSGSIRDNITYGREVPEAQLLQAVEAANLSKVVAELSEGLETIIGENGMTLSGGQRQRVAIARALVRDPRIIILDEATSALDVISEKEVQEAIDNLIEGRTTLIVAHRLSTIRKAGRVVVMKQGSCIELGTQQELMSQDGEFTRLKRLQA
jgi:ATP-binding cassette, subfamily B, bacterial